MKKLCTITLSAALFSAGSTFAQTFTYTNISSVISDVPGTELVMESTLINSTSSPCSLRVTRLQDVMVDAPNWTSAFCMDVCYLPTTDSVPYTFNAMDTVHFSYHMYTDATPAHARGVIKWRNVTTPSNSFVQAFIGITDGTSGINETENSAAVSIYPMPVSSNDIFTMNVSGVKSKSAVSMVIYNTLGSVVSVRSVMNGINLMDVNLSGGVYSYSLVLDGNVINSGKLIVAE